MHSGNPSDAPGGSRAVFWLGIALIAVWLAVALPAALGERTLYLRDVLGLHLPLKSFGAEELRLGRIPAFNPSWAMGQPFRGNPNALPFYPGNLLYLALPFWSAFNLHYLLHWLLAFFTMRGLARELGRSREAAFLAAATYAGSGWLLSTLSFYNLIVVAAWWPLAMTGALRGGRKGVAVGGLACGMALLGGEPWSALLAFVPLVWLAGRRHGGARGALDGAAVGLLGVILALPQLVATARVLGFTVRGGPGLEIPKAGVYALSPVRLLELVLPLPFGWPGELGRLAMWVPEAAHKEPFIYTIYFGVVGLWLAWLGRRRYPGLALLVLAGLVAAWLGGMVPELLGSVSGGTFRYPEKALIWLGLGAPLLAAAGLDRLMNDDDGPGAGRPGTRGVIAMAAVAGGAGILVALLGPALGRAVGESLAGSGATSAELAGSAAWLETHLALWLSALGVATVVLVVLAIVLPRRRPALLLVLQIACLAQLFPLVRTVPVAPLSEPSPWLDRTGRGDALVHGLGTEPPWAEALEYEPRWLNQFGLAEIRAHELDAPFGVSHGIEYPLAKDFEGLYSPIHHTLTQVLERLDWRERSRWLEVLGVEWLVMPTAEMPSDSPPVATTTRFGPEIGLYRVAEPGPAVWWPERLVVEKSPTATFAAVASSPPGSALVPGPVAHVPGAVVELESAAPDRWVIGVTGEGGVLVLGRSFHPILEARSGSVVLATMPVDFALQGVQVPPGSHRVVVSVSSRPESLATVLSVAVLVLALAVWWRS